MDQYLGATERAAVIRQELKAKHKLSSRDVSVKARHFSMGSAIDVVIKNPDVPFQAVKEIAEPHESINRDPSTGEILSGGNRYLHVGYSSEARAALAARVMPAVEAAARRLATAPASHLIPVEGTGFLLGAGRHGLGYGFSLWRSGEHGSHDAEVSDLKEAAGVIGCGGRR